MLSSIFRKQKVCYEKNNFAFHNIQIDVFKTLLRGRRSIRKNNKYFFITFQWRRCRWSWGCNQEDALLWMHWLPTNGRLPMIYIAGIPSPCVLQSLPAHPWPIPCNFLRVDFLLKVWQFPCTLHIMQNPTMCVIWDEGCQPHSQC